MDDLQIQAAHKAQAAGDAYDAALPGLVQSGFTTDSIVSAINQNPRAAGMILKESDARKKAALDQGKTAAETAKLEGETRKMDLAMVGGMAQSILSNPNSSARDLQTLGGIMQRVGINPAAFGDPSDKVKIGPGLFLMLGSLKAQSASPLTIDTTHRNLKLDSGSATIAYRIVFLGV